MAPILKASERGDLGVVNLLLTRVPQAVKTTDQVGVLLGIAYRCLTSRRFAEIHNKGEGPCWGIRDMRVR